ncbi:GvpL/GvpF family gas vesicle protein [Streptomyces tropicalis]|uniref:GvpL/GvpF family gas vesicle protein n=1 Tax=Streptomyces tropicalis TaxID=3034234 RepID=A0ABT6A2G9_9ACTN|nr:GvpL/GvpF family gas vesicle protein [Streptomyces tropicalis]MDF3298832.1 GvpL/GvpF family gas vesicle protein [Streptomyces tropicalis]
MAVYVYAITGASHPLRLDGITGVGDPPASLRTVTVGPLGAVISDAPDELRPKRRDLIAHQRVQSRLMEDGTVLPLRFGYTAPDDDAVREVLRERGAAYEERLRALDGCVEYHLKTLQEEDFLLRRILEESPVARALNDRIRGGAAGPELPLQLGELVTHEVQQRQQALADGIVEALRPHAREQETSRPTGDDFLSVSFLVDAEHEEAFLTTELDLARRMGEEFKFRLSGPLPPYSFV